MVYFGADNSSQVCDMLYGDSSRPAIKQSVYSYLLRSTNIVEIRNAESVFTRVR